MENKYQEALDNLIKIERADTFKKIGLFNHTNCDTLQELVDKEKTPTEEEIIKEWEEAGYELVNDYCTDFHFVKKIEDTVYDKPVYHHFVIEKINGGRYIPYSSSKKDDNFNNRQYFIISLQEHNLITKIFKYWSTCNERKNKTIFK